VVVIWNGTTISLDFISPLTAHSELFFENRRKSNGRFSIKVALWIIVFGVRGLQQFYFVKMSESAIWALNPETRVATIPELDMN
jgi:hypothetical protein